MQIATELLVWGILIHLVADWMLQNEWMAVNKSKLCHPAGWVHAGIHMCGFCLIFPWLIALVLGMTHLLIDTRHPLNWWLRVVKQTSNGPHRLSVEIWLDQVFHIAALGLVIVSVYR